MFDRRKVLGGIAALPVLAQIGMPAAQAEPLKVKMLVADLTEAGRYEVTGLEAGGVYLQKNGADIFYYLNGIHGLEVGETVYVTTFIPLGDMHNFDVCATIGPVDVSYDELKDFQDRWDLASLPTPEMVRNPVVTGRWNNK